MDRAGSAIIRSANGPPRILLMIEAAGDRRVVSACLGDRYVVMHAETAGELDSDFDLCVLDDVYYDQVWELIGERKSRAQPCFLPFVLLTSEKSRRSLSEVPAHEVDEVLEAPMSPDLLAARLRVLIERRRREQILTARHEDAADALAASEARLRALHDSLRDGFVQVAMDGRILDTNEVYRTMLGYSAEELQALTYLELTPEKWRAHEQRIVEEQVVPFGYSEVYEKEYRRRDGTIIPVELRTVLLRNEAGLPDSMWATVRDISERKRQQARMEEALEAARSSKAKLEEAVNTIQQAHAHELRARARAEALLMTATAIASGLALEEVLDSVCDVVLLTSPHSRVTVTLFERRHNRLVVAASSGGHPIEPGLSASYENVSEPAKTILEERRADLVDYDALLTGPRGAADVFAARLAFLVPLVYRGGLVGLLTVDDPGERREFDTFEREYFEGVGAQAAVAIENARLYEAERQSSRFAIEIAERRASLLAREKPEAAMSETLEHGVLLLRANAGGIMPAEGVDAAFHYRMGDTAVLGQKRVLSATRAAVRRLVEDMACGAPAHVESVDLDDAPGRTTHLAVTLSSDTEYCSALVFVREAQPFRSHELEFVRQLADTLGLATQEERIRREREWLSSARQEWLAGISHDLRTPLSTIRGYAMLLADDHDTPRDEVKRQAEIIVGQTQRIQALVADMLLMFQIREGRLPVVIERTDLVQILAELEESLRLDPRLHGRQLVLDVPDEPQWADVDGRLLERAVQNVATNAIVHNPEGTTVRLSVGSRNGWEEIVVSDDGLGMDEATLARVWARYERATGAGSDTDGVGLGMSITRQLVERMGGEVVVDSATGEGTTICMRVPRCDDSMN